MKKQPRVLFVDNDVNSFYSYRMGLAMAARRAGFEVHVASPSGRSVAILEREGLVFHPVRMSRDGIRPWTEAGTVLDLYRLYRVLQPDLVHHIRLKPVLFGGLAAYAARVPAVVNLLTGLGYIFTSETPRARILRRLVKAGCKLAFQHRNQRVIFQNPDDRGIFIDSKLLATSQSALIRGSGVDISFFTPVPERSGLPLVVLAGRMLTDKGVPEFVEAAGQLRSAGVKAVFALVGDTDPGNPSAIPTAQLRAWHESGVVEWWGHRDDMQAVLTQAHVVCLPSHREGVPKVLIEAAACGKPIVTTDAPGCREIVRNGVNGLLVPVNDSRALALALRTLIENEALRSRMGRHSREIAESEFSLEKVVAETLTVYKELLAA